MNAKYVFENIKFKRGLEPKRAMGIGIDRVKRWLFDADISVFNIMDTFDEDSEKFRNLKKVVPDIE